MSNTTENVYLRDLHFEHKVWGNELEFFEDEIQIYEHRLEDLVKKKMNDKEMLSQLEAFQNQFIRQKEVIDILKHDINDHEHVLSKYAEEHPIAIEDVQFKDHTTLRDRMVTFRKLYRELKDSFYQFLAKYLKD
jgi:hypothetical protein